MLAWKEWGNKDTPKASGLKGDHLVGKYYVEFDKKYKEELNSLLKKVYRNDFLSFDNNSIEQIKIKLNKIRTIKSAIHNAYKDISPADVLKVGSNFGILREMSTNEDISTKVFLKNI